LNAQLNIVGVYKLRTTTSELTGNSAAATQNTNGTATSDPKTTVEAVMNIKGSLLQPQYVFDLNFPDIDNSMNSSSISDLNLAVSNLRKEPESMTQQIISFIVFNRFISLNNSNNIASGANNNIGVNTLSEIASA